MKIFHNKKIIVVIFSLISFDAFAVSNYVRKFSAEIDLKKDYFILTDIDYRNNKERLFRRHYDAGIGKKFGDNFDIAVKYRQIYLQENGHWFLNEERPQIQAVKKFKIENFVLETRFRHDFRILKNDAKNSNRSRFRFRIVPEKYFLHLKPFISNEFYYDIENENFSQNRFETGVFFKKFLYFTSSIAFRNDSSKIDEQGYWNSWESDQILILRIDADF